MKIENLCVKRLIGDVAGATTHGHKIALKGGYIYQTFQGGYTLSPLGWRVVKNIENIIRQEMDNIDGQEILMPVVSGADLWRQSGRYDKVDVLTKFKSRAGADYVLNPTHEEVVVDFVKSVLETYRQLPFMVYQIQTKFRDELRVRAGLVRTREFIMKDAYSFHNSVEDLEKYYNRCLDAYNKIFARCGLKNFVHVLSSTGDMGGSVAHEFQLVNDMGEDTIYLCDCGFNANKEVVDGDTEICPKCGKKMRKVRGIEIGNIFQLGTKYSKSMELTYTAPDGTSQNPIMGCYGIGVGRTMAAIMEESADDKGPIWNMATAPFKVEIIALPDADGKCVKLANELYEQLKSCGTEVLLDTRDVRAGEKFADADLIAAPIRMIISGKNLQQDAIEMKYRVNNYDTSILPTSIAIANWKKELDEIICKLSK
ncbi:MAG: His/Gly/Thr/Pro-type tRNA ligase C-terminal domain-containing protein [Alphaproteobacteria bacterium]|nr:His/Gly/Thr/Pro-type tRNA ligase C-terminal domain-containing protein [Alphaproteobacteria bacterium]